MVIGSSRLNSRLPNFDWFPMYAVSRVDALSRECITEPRVRPSVCTGSVAFQHFVSNARDASGEPRPAHHCHYFGLHVRVSV